jgi:hypothetical protein
LLFERDQQLTALLSGELGLAGYEVHTSRTAVEVFDAIAHFPIRLVMVNLAQAQASRREFWVALDAQRRGRGVQVFTFRCSNVGGYGPDDPDEHVQTVATDLEVDGMMGIVRLVDAIRMRVPGATALGVPPRATQAPEHFSEMSAPPLRRVNEPPPSPMISAQASAQPLHASLRSPEAAMPPVPSARSAEPPRSGPSTFTDKIRAVIYPGSSRNSAYAAESTWQPQPPLAPPVPPVQQQQSYVDPYARPQSNQRGMPEETGLDQLSRLLQESHPGASLNGNGNGQYAQARPGLSVDQQELQELRAQLTQAAREDEAYGRTYTSYQPPQRPEPTSSGMGGQLRASPIQDVPFEREIESRRNGSGTYNPSQGQVEGAAWPAQALPSAPPPVQPITPIQETPAQFSPNQSVNMDIWANQSGTHAPRPLSPRREMQAETSMGGSGTSAAHEGSTPGTLERPASGPLSGPLPLSLPGDEALAEQVRANLQQTLAQRPLVKTSDDTLLDIVKSLPPMEPAPQPPHARWAASCWRATWSHRNGCKWRNTCSACYAESI